jgi:DNA-directed RNA polymerase subunit E'/Rpb7
MVNGSIQEMSKIVVNVSIQPHSLGEDIMSVINKEITKKVGTCTQENGYILSIQKISDVDSMISRASGEIIVRATVRAETFKPEVGKTYKASVSSCVNGNGIYLHYKDRVKILVMERMMEKYSYKDGAYTNGEKTINIGDDVDVTIKAVKYEKNNFQCIGSF